jgi:transposase
MLLSISYGTICSWINRFLATGSCESRQHLNPGPSCRYTDKQSILDYLAQNEDADGIEIRDALCPNIPMSTFYDTMSRLGITYKKKSRNISKDQRRKEKDI